MAKRIKARVTMDPSASPTNLGGHRDWGFHAEPNIHLDRRSLSMSMGKGLGSGSSVNVMVWARGHRSDCNHFAERTGDAGWGYDSVLDIYRRIENWQGAPDPHYRGTSGNDHSIGCFRRELTLND